MDELYTFERELAGDALPFCGVDEAGRGPLAGPVCAAAVILPEGCVLPGLNDSKKLSEKKREELYDLICERAVCCGVAFATVAEIEEVNIKNAAYLAMDRAIGQLTVRPALALVDGNDKNPLSVPAIKVVRGDGRCASIAAASILAKVTRDREMAEYHKIYPDYGFESNKGYGTKAHYEGIRRCGITPIHRKSFLKNVL